MKMASQQDLKKVLDKGYAVLVKHGVATARPIFDQAAELAIKYNLTANAGWSRFCSYSNYLVITLDDPNIGYIPSTKCGSTTVKRWLLEIDRTRKKHKGVRQAVEVNDDPHASWGYRTEFNFAIYDDYEKFIVIRDPLVRFMSFYFHYSDRIKNGTLPPYKGFDDHVDDIDFFVDLFCSKSICNSFVYTHTLPQNKFYHEAFSTIKHVFTVEKLDECRCFLENKFEMAIPELIENKSSRKKVKISAKSVEKILAYYQKDYDLFSQYYSVDESIKKVIA